MSDEEIRRQLVKSLSTAQVESVDNNGEAVIEYEADRLLQLLTADRKRVELEARIDELEKLSNIDWSDDGIEANDMVCEELKFRIAKLRSRNHLGKEEV